MTSYRQQHVSKLLQEELSLLVGAELRDPRLTEAMVNVTLVKVSPDLRSARVYVEHALAEDESRQILAALAHSESFLREALAANLNLRFVPHLTFQIDDTGEHARRVDELLHAIDEHDPPAEGQHAADDSAD